MSTYENLMRAAPDDMAKLIFEAGVIFGPYPDALGAFFKSLGVGFDLMAPAIREGRIVMEHHSGDLDRKHDVVVRTMRKHLP